MKKKCNVDAVSVRCGTRRKTAERTAVTSKAVFFNRLTSVFKEVSYRGVPSSRRILVKYSGSSVVR